MGITHGIGCTILGLVGDTTELDIDKISMEDNVERVMRVQEPYKKANRKFHPEDTVVTVGKARIGGGNFSVIAGPCSVVSPTRPRMVQPMPWVMPTSRPWARKVSARASISSFFVPGFIMITIVIFSFFRQGRGNKKGAH